MIISKSAFWFYFFLIFRFDDLKETEAWQKKKDKQEQSVKG